MPDETPDETPEEAPKLTPAEQLLALKKRVVLEAYNPDDPSKKAKRPMRINALRGLDHSDFTKDELQTLGRFLNVPMPAERESVAKHVEALANPPLVYNVRGASLDLLHNGGLYNEVGQALTGPISLHALGKHRHRFINPTRAAEKAKAARE